MNTPEMKCEQCGKRPYTGGLAGRPCQEGGQGLPARWIGLARKVGRATHQTGRIEPANDGRKEGNIPNSKKPLSQ